MQRQRGIVIERHLRKQLDDMINKDEVKDTLEGLGELRYRLQPTLHGILATGFGGSERESVHL